MNPQPGSNARDSDLRLSPIAMARVAERARRVAAQTGIALIVSRNGVIERIHPGVTSTPVAVQEVGPTYGDRS